MSHCIVQPQLLVDYEIAIVQPLVEIIKKTSTTIIHIYINLIISINKIFILLYQSVYTECAALLSPFLSKSDLVGINLWQHFLGRYRRKVISHLNC